MTIELSLRTLAVLEILPNTLIEVSVSVVKKKLDKIYI